MDEYFMWEQYFLPEVAKAFSELAAGSLKEGTRDQVMVLECPKLALE